MATALKKLVERDTKIPFMEDLQPRLPEAQNELAAVQTKFKTATNALVNARNQLLKLQDAPLVDQNDREAVTERKRAFSETRKQIEQATADRSRLNIEAKSLAAEIETLSKEAKKVILDSARPRHNELVKEMFLESVNAIAPALIARNRINQLRSELDARNVPHGGLPMIHMWSRLERQWDFLRQEAKELADLGIITAVDIPSELATAWGLK